MQRELYSRTEDLVPDDRDARIYYHFHKNRYSFLVKTLAPLLQTPVRVLDIGMSVLPRVLLRTFPGTTVATLGFADARYWINGEWEHYHCNLNDVDFNWTSVGKYHVVILAEVLEHLYVAPRITLRNLVSILEPGGHLIIQTPNAASLEKRVKLLFGVNPYEMIRDNPTNPGHYREYTVKELRGLIEECRLHVLNCSVSNYFNPLSITARLYNIVCSLMPFTFRDGVTILCQKRG
jgi:hypothetical protein